MRRRRRVVGAEQRLSLVLQHGRGGQVRVVTAVHPERGQRFVVPLVLGGHACWTIYVMLAIYIRDKLAVNRRLRVTVYQQFKIQKIVEYNFYSIFISIF